MSFNLSTKINNLYQLINGLINNTPVPNYITAQQDSFSGTNNQVSSSGGTINVSGWTNIQGTNITKPSPVYSYTDTTNRTNTEHLLGTIPLPSDFYNLSSIQVAFSGQVNPVPPGFLAGGILIRDASNNLITTINVGNNRDVFGNFNINENITPSISASKFPIKIFEYIFPGYVPPITFNNSVVPFNSNVYLNYNTGPSSYWLFNQPSQNFVCQKAGNYLITADNSMINNGTGVSNLTLRVLKNGSTFTISNYDSCGLNEFCSNTQVIYTSCNINDTISLQVVSTNFCRVVTTNLIIQEL